MLSILALAAAICLAEWFVPSAGVATVVAASGGFQGQVTDVLSREPIAGAVVSAGSAWATTDAQGRYILRVPSGTYEVRVRAEGYIGMSLTRQRAPEASVEQADFEMIPADPTPQQRVALDQIFEPRGGPELTPEELAALRAVEVAAAGVTQLPARIRVLMPDGVVVVMTLDEYIKGVLPREMPPYWPAEALKAQAVAARCYAANARRHTDEGADVCTTEHCQVWGPIHYETTDRAVNETHNVAATHSGQIISAFFFAHCDGHTKNSEDVWVTALPYCRSVSCPCGYTSYYGHGVGMCQQGARVLAEQGNSFTEILMHYYTDVQVTRVAAHALSDGRVSSQEGDTATRFGFEVLYAGHDPPIAAYVYIDGRTYIMSPVDEGEGSATLYRYSTTLGAGTHDYAFHFENGYDAPVNLPASGTFSGPTVQPRDPSLPTPTPMPLEGTSAAQWAQSTGTDFADGERYNAVLTADGDGAVALAPASTLGIYTSTVHLAAINFVAVGSAWQADTPGGTDLVIEIRSSEDGSSWSDWVTVPPMDAEREESLIDFGELVYLRGPYGQYRITLTSDQVGVSPTLYAIRLAFIDSRVGPTALEAQTTAVGVIPPEEPVIIPRFAWGADESLFNWPPEYRTPRKLIIHHTVTPNDDLDPAATVRAIYYYHAVTRGWGDIGYNYLIDSQGRIYEGRRGGEGVVGGHAKQYAWGSIGVSLIGNYEEVDVPADMETSLVELLAWKGNLHFIDPLGYGFFIDQYMPNIVGHRDLSATACPGRFAYARLPIVRDRVLQRMADLPPNVRIDAPAADASVGGVVNVQSTASPAVSEVKLYVDGALWNGDVAEPFAWKWNSMLVDESAHELRVTARTDLGLDATHTISVMVDNTAPTGGLSGPLFANSTLVNLSTPAQDAQQMLLSNGWHWEGEQLRHQIGHSVEDDGAWNEQAWMGVGGVDPEGWWYGPYLQGLPTGRNYRVYFRLKTPDVENDAALAHIDVSDDFGRNTYAMQTLTGLDFAQALSYVEPYLDFAYLRADTYGLEFRTLYTGAADLYLDRLYLFRAPRSYAGSVEWTLTEGDGPKEVSVRYLDAAGNPSDVYSTTITLDATAPEWLDWDGSRAQVRDVLSGLDVDTAQFRTSMDGAQSWGEWAPAEISASPGTTETVTITAAPDGATHLQFRIADRAGNTAESPAYQMPSPAATPTATVQPTPTPTTEPHTGAIQGRLRLQGRTQHEGAFVSVVGRFSTTTAADGSYSLPGLPPGSYAVEVEMPGYLEAMREGISVAAGAVVDLPDLTLRGGDVNGDCNVNLLDLVTVAANLGSPPRDSRADINGDGAADLRDLVLVSINLGRRCPSPW
jgi:hypothetical protein